MPYVYVNNARTLGQPYVQDGVRNAQSATYTTLQISTSINAQFILDMMRPNMSKLDVRISIKALYPLHFVNHHSDCNYWHSLWVADADVEQ